VGRLSGAFCFDSGATRNSGDDWSRALAQATEADGRATTPGLSIDCTPSPRDNPLGGGRFDSRGGDVCTWDGRLDNREELLARFSEELPEGHSDSAIALKLYQTGGIGGLRDLIGDWSLAIWDARARRLVLASDYAGIRPLYYHAAPSGVMWSSWLSDLVKGMGVRLLDEHYAARFLTRGHAAFRTPYRDVLPVPPGHAVVATERGIETEAFWRPPDGSIRFQDERAYEEQLNRLFREAVRVRLRTDSPVCAELSGGLDSSSVAAMADEILAGGSSGRLVTFSYTYEGCRDERFFRLLEQERKLSSVHFDLEKAPFVTANQAGNSAPGWWEPLFAELSREMNRIGSTVLLTGQLGDFVMGNTPDDSDQVIDYLEQRQYRQAIREAVAWGNSLEAPVYPILWRAVRTKYFGWTGSNMPEGASGGGPFAGVDSLSPALRKRLVEEEPSPAAELAWKEAAPGRRRRLRTLTGMLLSRKLQVPETLQHITYAHPFAHRPLVEFMMAIPAGVVCRPGEPRRLMRRAFAGLLPAPILKRRSKAAFGGLYRAALRPLAMEALKDSAGIRAVELGFLDDASVRARLEAFVNGLECNEFQLQQIILFEFWLRNRWEAVREPPPGGHRAAAATPRISSFRMALST